VKIFLKTNFKKFKKKFEKYIFCKKKFCETKKFPKKIFFEISFCKKKFFLKKNLENKFAKKSDVRNCKETEENVRLLLQMGEDV